MHVTVIGCSPFHHEIARSLARKGHKVQFVGIPCLGLEDDLRPARSFGDNVVECDLGETRYPFARVLLDSIPSLPSAAATHAVIWGGGKDPSHLPGDIGERSETLSRLMAERITNPLVILRKIHLARVKDRLSYHLLTLSHTGYAQLDPFLAGLNAEQAAIARDFERQARASVPGYRSTIVVIPSGHTPFEVFDDLISPHLGT